MPLTQLWEKSPDIVLQYNIKQIVSAAGDGILSDNSQCQQELRHYLKNIPAEKLFEHIRFCLDDPMDKGGYVLQDLVNEIGRRLDYEVENGIYQGRVNQIGFDGIWRAPNKHAIIVEIKTSDAYRMNLDNIAGYRNKLIANQLITNESSILIVVGRRDTGDLEAQIRGSRHAWDARIISIDALIKLLELKIKSDEEETTEKIRSLLVPFEYTRLDNIIDVVFATAKDVEISSQEAVPANSDDLTTGHGESVKQEHTPRAILDKVREEALSALGKREGAHFIAHKRAQYWSSDKAIRVVCPVSKKYDRGDYWYAFHPYQDEFLKDGKQSFLLLGCVNKDVAYAIPYKIISELLPTLYKTEREDRMYWHLMLVPTNNGDYQLTPKHGDRVNMKPYEIKVA